MKQSIKIFITMLILMPLTCKAQSFKVHPIYNDYPNSQFGAYFKYDKLEHFGSHAILVLINPWKQKDFDLWLSIGFGVIYETIDGIENERTLGFSVVDFIFDVAGAIAGVFLKDLFHQLGIYILVNEKGITLCL